MATNTEVTVGPYTIRRLGFSSWAMILTSTGECLRVYASFTRAATDAARYITLTANLSA